MTNSVASRMISVIITAVLLCVVVSQSTPRCPKESQYGPSSTSLKPRARIRYDWDAVVGDETYDAKPICLNENYEIVRRDCFNGVWYPKTAGDCYEFVCPKPFIFEAEDECSYVTTLGVQEVCPNITSVNSTCSTDCESRKCIYNAVDFLQQKLMPSYTTNATLIFDSRKLQLLLIVYSPESLDEDLTRCFTNDAQVDFDGLTYRKLVNVTKVFDSQFSQVFGRYSLRNVSVYDIHIDKAAQHQYWCRIFEVAEFRPVTTKKILAYREQNGNEYSIRVSVFIFDIANAVKNFCERCRMMDVLEETHKRTRRVLVLHLTTNGTGKYVEEEFNDLKKMFETTASEAVQILSFRSSDYCLPSVTTSGKRNELLHWKTTRLGSTALPVEICGNLVRRKCEGDFLRGAKWGNVQGVCADRLSANYSESLVKTFKTMRKIESESDFLTSVNTVMDSDDAKFLDTNEVLNSLDNFLAKNQYDVNPIKKQKLLIYYDSNVAGLALYGTTFRRVSSGVSYNSLNTTDLEFAVFLPENLTKVQVTVFGNDRLFTDVRGTFKAGSNIVRINSPKETSVLYFLQAPIILVFRPRGTFKNVACGFWNHDRWSSFGVDLIETFEGNFTACAYSRLGHFAMVVSSGEEVAWKDFEKPLEIDNKSKFGNLLLVIYSTSAAAVAVVTLIVLVTILVKRCRQKNRRK